jgi:hypothetical protein
MGKFNAFLATKKQMEEQQRKMREAFSAQIEGVFKAFFDEHPEVYGFAWNQYTPYFNDGETCTFRMNEVYAFRDSEAVRQAFEDGDRDLTWGDGDFEDGDVLNGWRSEKNEVSEFASDLQQFEDEFQYAFGDHASVFVTRNGVDVQEFDHD